MARQQPDHPSSRVLIVDDEPTNVRLLERILSRAGYTQVRTATAPMDALELINTFPPDILLLDLHMPQMDGLELMSRIRGRFPSDTFLPVIVLTADVAADTRERALANGATDFLTKPFDVVEVLLRIGNALHTRALHQELRQRNEQLELRVWQRTQELEQSRLDVLDRLALAAEFRDDATGEHTRRVGALAGMIARELGLPTRQIDVISRAAMLHDIGKIGVPDSILLKTHALTDAEFDVIRTHTVIGRDILAGSPAPLLQTAEAIAYAHHERWDGNGYHGMKADATPLPARIVTVADTWDVMRNDRPYRKACSFEYALDEIRTHRERQFDPAVVDAFLELVRRGEVSAERHA